MSEPVESTNDPNERPSWACVLCPPPRKHSWVPSDPNHVTCSPCLDRMRERLAEVAERFLLLDPRPGASGEYGGRGAPGFESRPPLSVHVVSLMDPRSSQDARVWVGRDGRVHAEQERPPPSIFGAMNTLAWSIAEHRDMAGPKDSDSVFDLVKFVDRHLDHVTRHEELAVEVDAVLRDLVGVLRPVTGDGRRYIGDCPQVVGEADPNASDPDAEPLPVRCGAKLHAPTRGDTIACPSCASEWTAEHWHELGRGLNSRHLAAQAQ